ncbi:unnamed protein product [Phytomonas sp. Hart1]|nr:unnamed protein product [Phytomonas sp. Hart1]|eukprot:CCW69865.1 unnamed protein product [Phytomonas sp. isolate Hart1]
MMARRRAASAEREVTSRAMQLYHFPTKTSSKRTVRVLTPRRASMWGSELHAQAMTRSTIRLDVSRYRSKMPSVADRL